MVSEETVIFGGDKQILLFVGRTRRITQYTASGMRTTIRAQAMSEHTSVVKPCAYKADSARWSSHRLSQNKKSTARVLFCFGGDKWTRTTDPLHVKQVL